MPQSQALNRTVRLGRHIMATASPAQARPRGVFNSERARNEALNAYLFLAPYLLVTLVFTVGVIIYALYISFNKFDLFTPPTWVGLGNYIKALAPGGQFVHSLVNVLWYVIIVVPVQTALALVLATMINVRV